MGFFDKGAELKGLENLKVLHNTVINVNLRGFHNTRDSNWVKPKVPLCLGVQGKGIYAPDTQNTFAL